MAEAKNLIMMATGVATAAKTARTNAIDAAKTDILDTVKNTTVNEAIKAKLSGTEITGLATKTEVEAVQTLAEQNAGDIETIQGDLSTLTTTVGAKANSADVYTKTEVDNKISAIPKFGVEVVTALPAVADASADKVYLVRTSDLLGSTNIFTEYILVNGAFEQLGTQELDLSNYATLDELAKYVLKNDIFTSGAFQTTYAKDDGSYAKLWNGADDSGLQYYNKTTDIVSNVGTSDNGADATAIGIQIYSKNKTSNSGVRLNINSQKAYYVKGANTTANGGSEDNELAVKGDITTAVADKANSADVYTKTEVDTELGKKADASTTYTKTEVDALINEAIAGVLEQIQTELNNE